MKLLSRILKKANGSIGFAMLAVVLVTAVLGSVWTPHDPLKSDLMNRFSSASAAHPFGTDMFGRDILSRLMRGAWVSVSIGLATWFCRSFLAPCWALPLGISGAGLIAFS